MSQPLVCSQCDQPTQAAWKVCPHCGAGLRPDPPSKAADGKASQQLAELSPWQKNIAAEVSVDRRLIGTMLLMIGVAGVVVGVAVLFTPSTIDRLQTEQMLTYASIAGGSLMSLVVVGLALMSPREGDAAAAASHTALSVAVSVLVAALGGGAIALASVVYLISDCFKLCSPPGP